LNGLATSSPPRQAAIDPNNKTPAQQTTTAKFIQDLDCERPRIAGITDMTQWGEASP